jgi:glc operon protein GlcG
VESAKKIAAVALAEARKNNWYMAIAVVDPSGTLVYYEKMDNTQTGSADVAIAKARTASLFKRPSNPLGRRCLRNPPRSLVLLNCMFSISHLT